MARIPAGVKKPELVELLDVDEQIKTLTARKKVLQDKVMRAYGDQLGTFVHAPVILAFAEAKNFDAGAFAERYPAERHPAFYASTVDRDAVPKELREQFVVPVRRLTVRRQA